MEPELKDGSVGDNSDAADLERLAEMALEYLRPWIKNSRRLSLNQTEKWKLLEDLYHNRRDLADWNTSQTKSSRSKYFRGAHCEAGESDAWRSDIILSPSYIVDSWADRSYQAVFSGPEWLTVIPERSFYQVASDLRYPTSFKLQELLLNRLALGQIHTRLYEALQSLCLFGTAFAKISWRPKHHASIRWERNSSRIISEQTEMFDCPVLELIPLDRALIDWRATHNDVQRHSGVGHIVEKSYEEITEMFDLGVYNVNRAEFAENWRDTGSSRNFIAGSLGSHLDSATVSDSDARRFLLWEWHGQIPTPDGKKEVIVAIVTRLEDDSIDNGLLIRISDSPALWSGLRPFVLAHYTPVPGPLGIGAVETNLDLIHSISQFLSQSQDNARLTANAMLVARRGSSAARSLSSDDEFVYPGKVWLVDEPDDIQPFPALSFPQAEVNSLINYLNMLLEKRTSVSDTTLGMSSRDKTATEAHILQESSMNTFTTRADLFARSFIEPMARLALSMIQQFLIDDQVIAVRDHSGLDVPLTVTVDEIQSGKYNVVATITRQDSTRVAKAQSIERALPTLAKFSSVLAEEGVRVSFSELIKRYLDLLGIDAVDRVFTRVQPETGQNPPELDESRELTPPYQKGGPFGPYPDDMNALAQFLQMSAQPQ